MNSVRTFLRHKLHKFTKPKSSYFQKIKVIVVCYFTAKHNYHTRKIFLSKCNFKISGDTNIWHRSQRFRKELERRKRFSGDLQQHQTGNRSWNSNVLRWANLIYNTLVVIVQHFSMKMLIMSLFVYVECYCLLPIYKFDFYFDYLNVNGDYSISLCIKIFL